MPGLGKRVIIHIWSEINRWDVQANKKFRFLCNFWNSGALPMIGCGVAIPKVSLTIMWTVMHDETSIRFEDYFVMLVSFSNFQIGVRISIFQLHRDKNTKYLSKQI